MHYLCGPRLLVQIADAYGRVDRLLLGSETIGTCSRLDDGLVITARHCVVGESEEKGSSRSK